MSELKFTEGPWHKKGHRVFWQKPDRNLPKDNLLNGLVCICATTEDNPPEVLEEAHANALLIAAAPEMYAMLEELYDNLNRGIKYTISRRVKNGFPIDLARKCSTSNIEIARRIKALLKKARGED